MELRCPFLDQSLGSCREITLQHFGGRDGEHAVEFAIDCVEVRDAVFPLAEVHLDDDPVKPCDDGYRLRLLLAAVNAATARGYCLPNSIWLQVAGQQPQVPGR